ncbi:hypothetical protein Tco_1047021 [Tanacetum coccineum]
MSSSTILVPSNSIGESVGSSISLVLLSDTKTELTIVPAVLPEITLEAEAGVVTSPAGVLDLVVHSDSETRPTKAPPSPDYHVGYDSSKSDPSEAFEPLPTQRCRSPTTSLQAVVSAPAVLSRAPADHLPPRKRLDDQSKMIGQMYEHFLNMPLSRMEETVEELQNMRARIVATEQ